MSKLLSYLPGGVKTVAVFGHKHPDGDCCGAMTAVARCIKEACPDIDVTIYAKEYQESLRFLFRGLKVKDDDETRNVDFAICVDCSNLDRLCTGETVYENARHHLQIDHHVTNSMFAEINIVSTEAVSTCEILVGMMDPGEMSTETASSLYTGIVHDSGIFRFEAVTPETMRKAALLLEKKVPFPEIIRDTLTDLPYDEKRIIAQCILDSTLIEEERFLYSVCPLSMQERFGLDPTRLGSVVDKLNQVQEADVCLFLYELKPGSYKGSLRSKSKVNVAKIAAFFGGGGHIRAAGFDAWEPEETILKVRELVKEERN